MRQLQCIECGGWYGEDFFRLNPDSRAHICARRSRCKECDQARRDAKKSADRYLAKARSTFNRHATKFLRDGIIKSRSELAEHFGWILKNMAHDIEHAFKNGCYICRRPFAEMPNGLQSLTLDILDPEQPPYYMTNVRYPCQTCNRGKSQTPPADFARQQSYRMEAQRRRASKAKDPYEGTLLQGLLKRKGWTEIK